MYVFQADYDATKDTPILLCMAHEGTPQNKSTMLQCLKNLGVIN